MTPMMQQYFEIKNQYKDYVLFYRLGDFYEMFFEDAKLASRVLELTLTGRDCGEVERAPMCGVPFHAADTYIGKKAPLPRYHPKALRRMRRQFLNVKSVLRQKLR